jgi:hypothetical protein
VSRSEGRAQKYVGFSEGKHGCTEKQGNLWVAKELGHVHL